MKNFITILILFVAVGCDKGVKQKKLVDDYPNIFGRYNSIQKPILLKNTLAWRRQDGGGFGFKREEIIFETGRDDRHGHGYFEVRYFLDDEQIKTQNGQWKKSGIWGVSEDGEEVGIFFLQPVENHGNIYFRIEENGNLTEVATDINATDTPTGFERKDYATNEFRTFKKIK